MRRIALEALALPSPVLFTHRIHAKDLRRLWELGVQTIPVIQNSQPSCQDDVSAFDHPNVPYLIAVSAAVAQQLRESGCKKPVLVIRHEIQQWYTPEELQHFRDEIRGHYGIKPDTLLIGMVGQFKVRNRRNPLQSRRLS